MVDLVGSAEEVIKLALDVKAAADRVRHNKATCVELANTVETLKATVEVLGDTLANDRVPHNLAPVMRAALTRFEEALRRGNNLVTACQRERNIIYLLFTSGWRAKQLLQVKKDINDQIKVVHFAVACDVLVTIKHHLRNRDPPPVQADGVMDNSNISVESFPINCMGVHIVEGKDGAPKSSSAIIFNLSELEAATNKFSEKNVIGQSGNATVYKGALPGELVAIKTYPDQSGAWTIRHYINVFQLLHGHENVVKFLGFCHADGREMVVEEYMPNGSLFEIINGSSQKLDWLSAFRVILGVAQGVAYLHSKHVIHLDLNPANIVFDSDMNPKISNFERSKLLDENVAEAVSYELVGTIGYMSPEYITDGIITMASDVFAFGVLLLHSLSGMRSSTLEQHPITWGWEVLEDKVMNGLLDSNKDQLKDIKRCIEIGLLCTQEFPKDRPTMPDVVEFLNGNEMLPTPKKPRFI